MIWIEQYFWNGVNQDREMFAAAPAWRLQDGLLVSREVGCGWALNSRQFQHEDCRISDDLSVKGTSHSQIILVHCSTIFFYDISQFWIFLGYEPKFLPPFQRHFQFLSGTSKASKSRQSCITARPNESLIASVRPKKVFQRCQSLPYLQQFAVFSCIVGTESEVREFLCQNRQCGTKLEPLGPMGSWSWSPSRSRSRRGSSRKCPRNPRWRSSDCSMWGISARDHRIIKSVTSFFQGPGFRVDSWRIPNGWLDDPADPAVFLCLFQVPWRTIAWKLGRIFTAQIRRSQSAALENSWNLDEHLKCASTEDAHLRIFQAYDACTAFICFWWCWSLLFVYPIHSNTPKLWSIWWDTHGYPFHKNGRT